jgi:hypothetical protein
MQAVGWRQHSGGVDLAPNWPVFFDWAELKLNLYLSPPDTQMP